MSESDLISVADAIAILDAAPVAPRTGKVLLGKAQGLRLAEDIRADRDYPPFDKSLMDGYAVRSADVMNPPVELEVMGEIAAGQSWANVLQPGQAVAIMTGAPIPAGADGVVPVEDCEERAEGGGRIRVLRVEGPSRFITPRGADCAARATVLRHGTRLDAAQLAVAASVGTAGVNVFLPPRAAVLSTGSELVEFDQRPADAQIRNSNNIMLMALLSRLGCEVLDQGIAADDPPLIRESILRGLESDILFVSGGMSMGRYDFVPRILQDLGVELEITKLRIKPGKPFIFGMKGPKVVFGLPGNPVSSFVCALRLCSRIIARMCGAEVIESFKPAMLELPLESNGGREFYQPAVLGGGKIKPLKWKGSADIYTLAAANVLIVRAENAPAVPVGTMVQVLEIPS